MNVNSLLKLTAAGIIGLCAVGIARADEMLKFRTVVHAVSVQSQDIGDMDGHTLSVARNSGLALFPDGNVGTTYFISVIDFTKGAGPVPLTYNNLTFNDGSVLWYRTSGTTTGEPTKVSIQGTGTVIGGTGRYAGAKGDVTFNGARVGPVGVGTDLYLDTVINVKK
jgi:hypothetical protein